MSDERDEATDDLGRTEEQVTEAAAATPYGTARVADSYGVNPHEHKPSQDTWVAGEADDKQAETGGAQLQPAEALANSEGEPSPGNSSEASESSSANSSKRRNSASSKPARTTESRTNSGQTASSSAASTDTARKAK